MGGREVEISIAQTDTDGWKHHFFNVRNTPKVTVKPIPVQFKVKFSATFFLGLNALNPFTTGNPFLGTKLLGFSIGRGSGALEGLTTPFTFERGVTTWQTTATVGVRR